MGTDGKKRVSKFLWTVSEETVHALYLQIGQRGPGQRHRGVVGS